MGMLRKDTWQKSFTKAFQDAQTFPIKGEEGFLRAVLWVIIANKLIQMKKQAWWISVVDSFFLLLLVFEKWRQQALNLRK